MLRELEDAIDKLDIPVDGDALARLIALRSRLDAAIAGIVAEFDANMLWQLDTAGSMTSWLRNYGGLTNAAAARLTHLAHRMRQLPALAEAWRTGTLSAGQVDAILANLTERTLELFAEQHHALVPMVAPLSVADTVTVMRHWKARAEADLDDIPATQPARVLYTARTLDGCRDLRGYFDTEGGEIIDTALQLADDGDRDRIVPSRRADALVEVCRFFLTHHDAPPTSRHRPHLNLIVDTRTGHGSTIDGVPLPDDVVSRLACDSLLRRVTTEGSAILDYSRATRIAPPGLWNAIVLRDRHCRWYGCDQRPQFCQAHHVVEWERGGVTAIDNMCLLCTRHHHRAHHSGWQLKLLPDGELHVTEPHGVTHITRPPGPHLTPIW